MSAGDYGPRPPVGEPYPIPPAEMTPHQLLLEIYEGQRQIREFIVTAAQTVEAATATIASADKVIAAATKVIDKANTANVPQSDLDALANAQGQLATDAAALQAALDAEPTSTATATTTSTAGTPTSTATASTGTGGPTSTATATTTAEVRAAEIRGSHLS